VSHDVRTATTGANGQTPISWLDGYRRPASTRHSANERERERETTSSLAIARVTPRVPRQIQWPPFSGRD
jgi:hypothetical protein